MQEGYKFYTELNVRYEETDQMSVVYYGKYFVYFEVARTEYLKNIGHSYPEIEKRGMFFVVAEVNCKYLSPARYDDMIRVYTKVDYVKNSSFNFVYDMVRILPGEGGEDAEEPVAKGNSVLVCVDRTAFKPIRMPDYLRTAVLNFESK